MFSDFEGSRWEGSGEFRALANLLLAELLVFLSFIEFDLFGGGGTAFFGRGLEDDSTRVEWDGVEGALP